MNFYKNKKIYKITKKLLKNNEKINFFEKKNSFKKFMDVINENQKLLNLEKIKHKIKKKEIVDLDYWDKYKTKNVELVKKYNKKTIEFLLINNNQKFYINVLKNISYFFEKHKKHFLKSINIKIVEFFNFYFNISIGKIKKKFIKNTKKVKETDFLIINLKQPKIKITLIKKNECVFNINNGFIFKKLKLINKKNKKSYKVSLIAIKTAVLKINNIVNKKKLVINFRGLNNNNNYTKIINFVLKNTKNKNNLYINNLYINKNTYFNFKKIKAIKRKLKKKNIKT